MASSAPPSPSRHDPWRFLRCVWICVIALAIMRSQGAALARLDTQALVPAVYCTGRRPDAAGGWARAYEGGTSARRKGCCGCCGPVGSPWADGILDWSASTAPPASAALPSRPPGAPDHGWGRAEEWPRPRPVPPPERLRRAWGESRRRRGFDHGGLADSEGSPRPAPSSGPAGGPNQGRVGGARKSKSEAMSKCEARANANSGISVASSDHRISRVTLRVWARTLCSVASVDRPYSG